MKKNLRSLRKKSELKHKERGKRFSIACLLPSVFGVVLFFIAPFFYVIYYSMIDNPINREFVFMDNFAIVSGNAAFQQAASNTLKFSGIAVPLAVILALMLALMLNSRIPFRSQFRTFFLTPMMVPIASIVLIWQVLFHFNGIVNEMMLLGNMTKIDWFKSDYAPIVVVILFLWKTLGYNMILFMAALSSIPKEIIEVASMESARPFQIFWLVKLRYLSATILFVTIMSLINSFKVFREIYLLTGDYPFDSVYMLQHYMNNMFGRLDYQRLSAAAIMMSIAMVIIIGVMFLTENYFGRDIEG
ncbi:MAG: sugar ABC transporter permease [Lachnospiraceae bacterium]|jgi:multiple sugar transport system permease protein|nr:sugar ABC transporter permease [Lachnospiraceae bacterium]